MRILLAALMMLLSMITYADTPPAIPFTLTTTAFLDEGAMPVLYTCDGKDISPALNWSDAPAKTVFFALIFSDPEAPNGPFYHWVLYNIPKTVSSLAENLTKPPAGAVVGKNSFEKFQYNGPCPPKGSAHTYVFTLYALDAKLNLAKEADAVLLLNEMKAHIIGKVQLTTTYSRWIK